MNLYDSFFYESENHSCLIILTWASSWAWTLLRNKEYQEIYKSGKLNNIDVYKHSMEFLLHKEMWTASNKPGNLKELKNSIMYTKTYYTVHYPFKNL